MARFCAPIVRRVYMELKDICSVLETQDKGQEMVEYLNNLKKSSDDTKALLDSSNAKIEELSTSNEQMLKTLREVKAKNYDLLMAQSASDSDTSHNDSDTITIDSLFKE